MKPEQLYQELKDLAEKIGIKVCEQNLKLSGIHVKSGLCRIRQQALFIMDKAEPPARKLELLAECLGDQNLENVYVVPVVREYLETLNPTSDEGLESD